jgi:LPXTG-motif cell wall-anchored protein
MDSSIVVRIVSGILFMAVLGVLVWRRKRTA